MIAEQKGLIWAVCEKACCGNTHTPTPNSVTYKLGNEVLSSLMQPLQQDPLQPPTFGGSFGRMVSALVSETRTGKFDVLRDETCRVIPSVTSRNNGENLRGNQIHLLSCDQDFKCGFNLRRFLNIFRTFFLVVLFCFSSSFIQRTSVLRRLILANVLVIVFSGSLVMVVVKCAL